MRKLIALLFLGTILLACGCKSTDPVSRLYRTADIDSTWDAALQSVHQVTGSYAAEADKQNHRIVTQYVYRNSSDASGHPTREAWYAVINLEPAEDGTMVTVQINRRNEGTSNDARNPTGTTRSFTWTTDKSLENRLLNEISAELDKARAEGKLRVRD